MILDEPTNHLDIDSREMLEEALTEFKGTILFISHDRFFINKLAERICEIEDKKIINYYGSYQYYREKKNESIRNKTEVPKKEKINKQQYSEKPKKQVDTNKLEKAERLENTIQELEVKLKDIDIEMQNNGDRKLFKVNLITSLNHKPGTILM